MDRKRPASGWRTASLAAALLAITLSFLQPLAHAALMRDGGHAAAAVWKSMCLPAGQDDGTGAPQADRPHECCLGLAHAPALPTPSAVFAVVLQALTLVIDRPLVADDALAPVGIRDGPSQPHGPPLIA